MPSSTRKTYLAATLNGAPLSNILSARCSFGFDLQVSEAVIYVPYDPVQGLPDVDVYDVPVTLSMGAGTNNAQRFAGLFRRHDFTLYPRAVGLVCYGPLIRAQQHENNQEGVGSVGGLDLNDLVAGGGAGATDQQIVQAVLARVLRLSFSAGNIGGTGVVMGSQTGTASSPSAFLWRNGTNPSLKMDVGGKGETALEYIQRIDAISAVATPPPTLTPAGFYRTYETLNGTIVRALIGSRPRVAADFFFTEGQDIESGTASREYPLANRVYVQGYDYGNSFGPVSNLRGSLGAPGESSWIQGNNTFMPASEAHTYTFSSPLIERGLDEESGQGMSCETVANALMLDVNRVIVKCDFVTPRDDLIGPGATIQVSAAVGPTSTNAGGTVDRLGIGENLWVTHVDVTVDAQGRFRQRLQCLGGGLPDNFTPAPPF